MQRVSQATGIRQLVRCIRRDIRADQEFRKDAALVLGFHQNRVVGFPRPTREKLVASGRKVRACEPLVAEQIRVSVWHVKVNVIVKPKEAVLDPQGNAVRDAMRHLGMPEVRNVRIGKYMEIDVEGDNVDLEKRLHGLCRDLLSNPVIEEYELQKAAQARIKTKGKKKRSK
jgi:phosphoribosylformylglycinamidine synthase PurS subunit